MASPQGYAKLFANATMKMVELDADATTALAISGEWVDMRDYEGFAILAMTSVLGGNGITLLEIVAADDTSGTNITQIKTSGTVAADAVGDMVVLECSAQEIQQESEDAGYTLRYVNARLTHNNSGDESVVTFIQYGARHPQNALTANIIA